MYKYTLTTSSDSDLSILASLGSIFGAGGASFFRFDGSLFFLRGLSPSESDEEDELPKTAEAFPSSSLEEDDDEDEEELEEDEEDDLDFDPDLDLDFDLDLDLDESDEDDDPDEEEDEDEEEPEEEDEDEDEDDEEESRLLFVFFFLADAFVLLLDRLAFFFCEKNKMVQKNDFKLGNVASHIIYTKSQ